MSLLCTFFSELSLRTLSSSPQSISAVHPMDPKAQVALAAAAIFVIVAFLFALAYLLCKKPSSKTRARTGTRGEPSSLTSITIRESAFFDPSLDRISMSELLTATRNFSPDGIIGDGSFGLVYKACLSNGVTVAVKKLSEDAFQGFREFQAEMETLGEKKIRHVNLVRILGYCVSGNDRILIYEFIEKGSLDQWLHDTGTTTVEEQMSAPNWLIRFPLSWEIRVKIIKGVAEGLLFLHTLDTPIIHRDIKASNVLLDAEFEAHIADFGLARRVDSSHSHVFTQVAGTMGYMPPEYKNGITAATTNADVYSFGVLMIEVATGRRPNWPLQMDDGNEVGLVDWAQKKVAQGQVIEMIDATVSRENLVESGVAEFMRIACWCTSERAKDRPFMGEVVTLLKQL